MRLRTNARRTLVGPALAAAALVASTSCGGGNGGATPLTVPGGVPVTMTQPAGGKPCLVFEQQVWTSEVSLPGSGTFNGGFTKTRDNFGEFTPDSSGFRLKIPMERKADKTTCA